MTSVASPNSSRIDRRVRLVVGLLVALLLVALAWWMTGPAPLDADEGLPASPPPLALPTGESPTGDLARAAAALAAGDLKDARARFVDVVAETPDDPVAQTGLILSGWRSVGPVSVERDLSQLAREYPDSALVALHLGLVRAELREQRAARSALHDAVQLGRDADDATGLRMARLAEDLLHPDGFAGYVPALVRVEEVPAADRAGLRVLRAALERDDRVAAATAARDLSRSSDAMTRVAAAVGAFDKAAPDDAEKVLRRIASERTASKAARDRARFHAVLVQFWGGGKREESCDELVQLAAAGVDAGTRRLATPIHRELCARTS